jgi:hypothetical protein
MSELREHQQNIFASAVSDLTFALRTRGKPGANVKSTALVFALPAPGAKGM